MTLVLTSAGVNRFAVRVERCCTTLKTAGAQRQSTI